MLVAPVQHLRLVGMAAAPVFERVLVEVVVVPPIFAVTSLLLRTR
jgi:hypothetical protein